MKTNVSAIWQMMAPMAIVVLVTGILHFSSSYFFLFTSLTPTDLALNYLLLFFFFVAGEAATFSAQGITAQKKEFKRGVFLRFGLATLFLIFSTENTPEPFFRALHFIVPFMFFTLFSFKRFKKRLSK